MIRQSFIIAMLSPSSSLLSKPTLSSMFASALSPNNPNTKLNTQSIKNAPLALSEELGCSPTLTALFKTTAATKDSSSSSSRRSNHSPNNSNSIAPPGVYFDPLGLATDENFGRYREAELKHGRVSMLVVWIAIVETSLQQTDPIRYFFRSGQTPHLLELAKTHDWLYLAQILGVTGILETLLLVQASPQDMPGDYGLGYFGVRDKGRNERSLVCELENGRLAMMVLLYYALKELMLSELSMSSASLPEEWFNYYSENVSKPFWG
ncbi:MAG: hypothetical protein SGBAC_008040 [Bacillariaceae sp.]